MRENQFLKSFIYTIMKSFLKLLFSVAAIAFVMPFLQSDNVVVVAVSGLATATVVINLITPYVNTGVLALNNADARMIFENSKEALKKAFPGIANILSVVKLTQGTLRFEQPLVAGQTMINFPVLDNQALFSNTEDRLLLQDSFIISGIKIATGAPSSSTDNTFLLDSYPNTQKYGANAAPLGAFWNATNMQIAVNNDIILPKWDVFRHFNSPETQQTAALGAGSPGDQDRGAFDGWYPVEPNIVLIGSKNTTIQILFKGPGLTTVQANSRAIVMVRGVLAQNSTVVS